MGPLGFHSLVFQGSPRQTLTLCIAVRPCADTQLLWSVSLLVTLQLCMKPLIAAQLLYVQCPIKLIIS